SIIAENVSLLVLTVSDRQRLHTIGTRQIVDARSERRPQSGGLRTITAARQRLVDLPPVVDDTLHFGFCFDPPVGGVELSPQTVRRLVQLTEGVVQRVFLVAGSRLLTFSGALAFPPTRRLSG